MARILLYFGNTCTTPKISPKNWNEPGAALRDWYIHYRFNGKLQIVKGMNCFHTLGDRRIAAKKILENEVFMLTKQGFNPITKQFKLPDQDYVDPHTPLVHALQIAYKQIQVAHNTKLDIAGVLKFVIRAATNLQLHRIPIGEIKRKHVKQLLDQCGQIKKRWTPNTFNAYRKYLMIIFNELIEMDAIDFNPAEKIRKEETVQRIRIFLSKNEREEVNKYLHDNYFNYWRYMHIFFHSGSRTAELFRVKIADIDLPNQKFKCTIRKGRKWREVWKTIKDIALPFWKELVEMSGPDDFLFSEDLVPGKNSIRPDQITKRWTRLVMKPLGIKATFYSLKHLNTTETVDLLDENAAAAMNSHTSTGMVIKIYDVKRNDRQHERLKGINNPFA